MGCFEALFSYLVSLGFICVYVFPHPPFPVVWCILTTSFKELKDFDWFVYY